MILFVNACPPALRCVDNHRIKLITSNVLAVFSMATAPCVTCGALSKWRNHRFRPFQDRTGGTGRPPESTSASKRVVPTPQLTTTPWRHCMCMRPASSKYRAAPESKGTPPNTPRRPRDTAIPGNDAVGRVRACALEERRLLGYPIRAASETIAIVPSATTRNALSLATRNSRTPT